MPGPDIDGDPHSDIKAAAPCFCAPDNTRPDRAVPTPRSRPRTVLLFRLLTDRDLPCSDGSVLNPTTTPSSSLSSIGEGVLAVYGG